jgi:tRNA pseudouridine55 synthase
MSKLRGILPLLKPAGYTSHDCVNKLRKILHTKRIGHTGTLDPSVTGVLPICIGQATRVVEYIQELPKEYEGILKLGTSTSTEDADGEVIEMKEVTPILSEEQVRQAISHFIGPIEQIPPMYSAVKVGGVRLHQLARQGKEIERKPRAVVIHNIDILSMSLESPFPEVAIRVSCSKGTYIRTLCVDIGKKLGYPAHMKSLKRTKSGPFSLHDCVTFEDVMAAAAEQNASALLKPIDCGLKQFPSYFVLEKQISDVWNGKLLPLESEGWKEGQLIRIYTPDNELLALYRVTKLNEQICGKPEKVFHGEGE